MSETLVGCLFMLAIGIFLIFGVLGGAALITDHDCLAQGYREGRVSILLSRYCVARVDQTDVVVPFDDAMRGPRR
jgi:hypothetical protein